MNTPNVVKNLRNAEQALKNAKKALSSLNDALNRIPNAKNREKVVSQSKYRNLERHVAMTQLHVGSMRKKARNLGLLR